MEGVSDDAAAALSSGRANSSYVYRGTHRPTLLYTGRLEQTMTFVSAFHRSPIVATLVLTGGGVDAAELQSLAATDKRITLKGFCPTTRSRMSRPRGFHDQPARPGVAWRAVLLSLEAIRVPDLGQAGHLDADGGNSG